MTKGKVIRKLVPKEGRVIDLFKAADSIVPDPNVELARADNPVDTSWVRSIQWEIVSYYHFLTLCQFKLVNSFILL